MTPSLSGRIATVWLGVRPIMRLASAPTARTPPVLVLIATTAGSLSTMPRPRTYTRVFAVPRSTAISRPRNARLLAMRGEALPGDRWAGRGTGAGHGHVGLSQGREEQRHLARSRLRRVAAVHHVLPDVQGVVAAHRTRRGLDRIGHPHEPADRVDRAGPLDDQGDERPGGDEVDELAEERLVRVLGVVPLGDAPIQRAQLERDEREALALQPGDDLADQPAPDAVRFDEDEGALEIGHEGTLPAATDPQRDHPQQPEQRSEHRHRPGPQGGDDRGDLHHGAQDVAGAGAQQPDRGDTGEREPAAERGGGLDAEPAGDREDRDREQQHERLEGEHARREDPHRAARCSSRRAAPTVTTDPVTRTPVPPSPSSSASDTAASIASSSRGATSTRSAPNTSTATAASASADRARGESLCVMTTSASTGSRASSTPRTSLSASIATTPTRRVNANASDNAAARAPAPAGLCAASSSTVGLERTTSSRPGDVTRAKAARTTSPSSSCRPPPTNASTAARASVAFCAWCAPCSGRNTSSYPPVSPRSDSCWPPTATRRVRTPNSSPSRATVAPTSAARPSSTCAASSGWCASRTSAPGCTMPAFSRALSATVAPSSGWSSAIGVTTTTGACTTFVASHSPPIPTSRTATSTGASANAANAIAVSSSK